jgi:hypothetical protein
MKGRKKNVDTYADRRHPGCDYRRDASSSFLNEGGQGLCSRRRSRHRELFYIVLFLTSDFIFSISSPTPISPSLPD